MTIGMFTQVDVDELESRSMVSIQAEPSYSRRAPRLPVSPAMYLDCLVDPSMIVCLGRDRFRKPKDDHV